MTIDTYNMAPAEIYNEVEVGDEIITGSIESMTVTYKSPKGQRQIIKAEDFGREYMIPLSAIQKIIKEKK